ncbi:hypothetical protein BX285_2214 [Streptomyces sp. 1114.5]|uniref:hypothetical protein n=1 Tax=unclassified Streptomyces TaxID=2593676 RepID=UPI000BDCAE24|nr:MULTISPECIES: hypothetical protein [unclassified Streptomyces]RKT17817.1 hypothetical protein BX285_2214 [Streptomyces sp. 1114.5]SOB84024.1 hypothetical protein SAMN06272789_4255 [Streptomyces sp. 1331.2]
MRLRAAVAALALPLSLALAPTAFAAETAKVVSGPPSAPGGVSTATCPPGTHLTGGGYRLRPDADGPVRVNAPTADATGWSAQAERGSVVAFAVCETED